MTKRPPTSTKRRNETRKPSELPEWTVMVYMAGDNNLSADCVWALTEMHRGMRSDKIKVIAQFDPSDGMARTRRYEITKQGVILDDTGRKGAKQPNTAKPQGLDDLPQDSAGWNPWTEEVHFSKESRKASDLARHRRLLNKKHWKYAQRIVEKGMALNANLKPDDLGASRNDTDAASPITLYNFLSYGIQFHPAHHYMVVLSGHSAGIEPSYLLKDDSSGGSMTFRQLRVVFDQLQNDLEEDFNDGRAKKIDILGFDTCLMSMAEVCCDLMDCVDIVIGSETYTPSSGWPYQTILQDLCESVEPSNGSHPAPLDPCQLAEVVVKKYVAFYRAYVKSGVSVALSALDVTRVGGLAPVVKRLTSALMRELKAEHPELKGKPEKKKRPVTDALVLAHWEAQSYNGEWYVDLVDFCECLKNRSAKKEIRTACDAVIKFLKDTFVIESDFTGATYQHSHGVAIYFPWSCVATYFWGFEFATLSGWGDFLAYYTNVTRRKFRVPEKPDSEEQKRIQELEEKGGNYFNYARNADKLAVKRTSDKRTSDKRTSDKRTSDKGHDIMVFNRMSSDKRTSDKRTSDKRASDKMASDKMASDKMGSDKSGNPIHSMRNPPVVSIDFDF